MKDKAWFSIGDFWLNVTEIAIVHNHPLLAYIKITLKCGETVEIEKTTEAIKSFDFGEILEEQGEGTTKICNKIGEIA